MQSREELQERIIQLEKLLGLHDSNGIDLLIARSLQENPEARLKLTKTEAKILGMLYAAPGVVTYDAFYTVIYSGSDECPEPSTIIVIAYKLRKKLKLFDIYLETVWGVGYRMDADNKAKLKSVIERSK